MPRTHFNTFITEAIDEDAPTEKGLRPDELYGLYTSWCLLNKTPSLPDEALWEYLKSRGINPEDNHLGMKGPAAGDYILASVPSLT
ncbi:hypothetical protein J2S98_004567 [Arthrobacter oryzae]|uniref:hypothetical protein n=1 Tax=Arthrobacter TaxID=1663 RepID=UPI001F4726A4|nr:MULTISPECIES: hypothetical protein [Arthrobacter]MDP9989377.1 hypothetical protein [Arthrobacter oryzae]UKA71453.1 hypothetical protein LFT49_01505 [Arthrobacter sp. FW306-06-A]